MTLSSSLEDDREAYSTGLASSSDVGREVVYDLIVTDHLLALLPGKMKTQQNPL